MIHAALMDAILFFFLLFLTLLLVTFVGAVIVAPSAPPGSASPEAPVDEAPAPAGLEAATPPVQAPVPLPHRRPLTTATAAGTTRWSDAGAVTNAPPSAYNGVRRPKVKGSPPWGPAPKPSGPDPWAAETPSPGGQRWPDQRPESPAVGRRPTSSDRPPGTPAPAGAQARYPRHGAGR
jgi:hypothetical protein